MKTSLTVKMSIMFSVLGAVVLFNFIILTKTEKEVSERHTWVLHTHEVIEEAESFLGHLRDAETGQRGFLLTLDQNYLEPFYSGTTQSRSKFSTIRKLTEDNMEQQKRLGQIQELMLEKISVLEKTIDLAQQDKISEAIEILNSGIGKNTMDSIREYLREFISIEKNLLKQRNAVYFQANDKLKVLFYANILVLIVLVVISFLFIQKTIVRPITDMSKSIVNARHDLHGSDVNITT